VLASYIATLQTRQLQQLPFNLETAPKNAPLVLKAASLGDYQGYIVLSKGVRFTLHIEVRNIMSQTINNCSGVVTDMMLINTSNLWTLTIDVGGERALQILTRKIEIS
jgi:hypothetical protein